MVEGRHSASVEDCWKGGKKELFMYCSCTSPQKKFIGLSPFADWGFIVSHCQGRAKYGFLQHILGIWGFKFHNWGSRELARKNTRLPRYFNGFREGLGRGLIIASGLSGDCAGVFLKFRWIVRKWCLTHTPKESMGCSPERLMRTHMVFPLIKAEQCMSQIKPETICWLWANMPLPAIHDDDS